jgi:membrane-bound lytic murein transglycosylase D
MKYGVSVSRIKKWNELRSDRINIGQKLTIYYPKNKEVPQNTPPAAERVNRNTTNISGNFTLYEVQPGDTLWAISRKFDGIKPEQIMQWNGIDEDIQVGQKLKIKTAD